MRFSIAGWIIASLISLRTYAADVLLVRFDSPDMNTVAGVVKADLKGRETTEFFMDKDTSYAEFLSAVKKNQPKVLAVFDNKAVNFAIRMHEQGALPKGPALPVAATMALNLKNVLKNTRNMCGIAYEVPAFTILTKFRSLVKSTLTTVLAPYRKKEFDTLLNDAKGQLGKENIRLIPVDVEQNGDSIESINKTVAKLLMEGYNGVKIDAIMIPADNLILNNDSFTSIWVDGARKLKIPFLCNVDKFASREFDFCTFAASPDFVELGHQFAEQIHEILQGTPADELGVDYILAAKSSLNLYLANRLKLPLDQSQMSDITVFE